MLTHKTLFVLGAGASLDYGYPLGDRLIRAIQDRFNAFRTSGYESKLALLVPDMGPGHPMIGGLLSSIGTVSSIDEFMHRFSDDKILVETCKLCIAGELSDAETGSVDSFDMNSENCGWYQRLWKGVFEGVPTRKLESYLKNDIPERLSVVTFNYDISLEYSLWRYLQSGYRLSPQEAFSLSQCVVPLHVFGTIVGDDTLTLTRLAGYGKLSWEQQARTRRKEVLAARAAGIRTIYDGPDQRDVHVVKAMCRDVETAFLLGNGYHRMNMDFFRFDKKIGPLRLYCTSKSFSPVQVDLYRESLSDVFGPRQITIQANWLCHDVMSQALAAVT